MLKVEGENRINVEQAAHDIAERYQVSDKTGLKWLCMSLPYLIVMASIIEEIDYLLEQGVIKR